jgi:hypothetical protein
LIQLRQVTQEDVVLLALMLSFDGRHRLEGKQISGCRVAAGVVGLLEELPLQFIHTVLEAGFLDFFFEGVLSLQVLGDGALELVLLGARGQLRGMRPLGQEAVQERALVRLILKLAVLERVRQVGSIRSLH